ncbi:response regulator [bacterium]|nr:response regulator [bacterium]
MADSAIPPGDPGQQDSSKGDLEDQIQISQEIAQELLVILGEAWSEVEALKSENKRLSAELPQAKPRLEIKRPGQQEPEGILIVDDSRVLRLRLKSILESLGHKVVGAADNGAFGADLAISLNPQLIILDYTMPVVNGLDCLKSIREQGSETKVIVCSGYLTKVLSHEFLLAGADEILTKPIQLDLFIRAVRKCMGYEVDEAGSVLGSMQQ